MFLCTRWCPEQGWSGLVPTDGAPSMIGKKAGVVQKIIKNVQTANGGRNLRSFHCIVH